MPKTPPDSTPTGSTPADTDPNETAGYSSPPCYAHEVDPNYFMPPQPMPAEEVIAFLNTLLEAERAGAKTIAYYLKAAPEGRLRAALEATGRDEGRYTAMLRRQIERLGGSPSSATGSFFEKARALDETEARLAFLNRGQGWVARKLKEALPRITDPELHEALCEMHRTHVENIARCEAVGEAGAGG